MDVAEKSGELCGAESFPRIMDWELAYSNRRAVSDASDWLERSAQCSAEFLRNFCGKIERDLAYGDQPRERIDIFEPESPALGTVVVIHGGYWRASSKESHWHFGGGLLDRGWRVAHVEYPLCPHVRIRNIADSTRRAVEFLVERVPSGPVMMVGRPDSLCCGERESGDPACRHGSAQGDWYYVGSPVQRHGRCADH